MDEKKKPVLVQINGASIGSTGKIMRSISTLAQDAGFASHMICAGDFKKANGPQELHPLSHVVEQKFQRKINKFTGMYGHGFPLATRQLIRLLDELRPDIVQLHNLHHQFFDVGTLFDYLKKKNIPTFWTIHDCWAWTGCCGHYTANGCDAWKTGCASCKFLTKYPVIYRDTAHTLFCEKQQWYGNMPNLTMIAPSEWILKEKEQSFLKDIPTVLIRNGIDLNLFRPRESDFRKKYGLEHQFIVLGVSFDWTREKGIDTFVELSKILPDSMKIVLVGGKKSQVKDLPPNILWIPRTESQEQLAEIYTAADVFVNPTLEEVLGLVNIEALACGTPVVTFQTGGSPECLDESCGTVVPKGDIQSMAREAAAWAAKDVSAACHTRAQLYDKDKPFREYIKLYRKAKQVQN